MSRFLLYTGIVVVVGSLGKLHAAWLDPEPYDFTGSSRFVWSFGYVVVLAISAYVIGLPDLVKTRRSALFSSYAAVGLGALVVSFVQLLLGDAFLPRSVVFGSALLLGPWNLVCTEMARMGRDRVEGKIRVVVVAMQQEAESLRADLGRELEQPATLVGVISIASASGDGFVANPLVELAEKSAANLVVLSRDAQNDDTIVGQAAALHASGVRIRTLSLFYEQWLGKLPVSELERVSLLFDIGELHRSRYGRIKRALDVGCAFLGLIGLGVATPFVVLGNVVANRGPLFYRQQRIGKDGGTFEILKFRTMHPIAEGGATDWTSEDDPRITSFGHILRRTHLDEIPQALNMLRGELSLVGPRPEQPHYVAALSENIPFYAVRHLVRPGLTGWAQVKYGYGSTERDALEKLQYDVFYLRHQSLLFDLRITVRTLRTVVLGANR